MHDVMALRLDRFGDVSSPNCRDLANCVSRTLGHPRFPNRVIHAAFEPYGILGFVFESEYCYVAYEARRSSDLRACKALSESGFVDCRFAASPPEFRGTRGRRICSSQVE